MSYVNIVNSLSSAKYIVTRLFELSSHRYQTFIPWLLFLLHELVFFGFYREENFTCILWTSDMALQIKDLFVWQDVETDDSHVDVHKDSSMSEEIEYQC